MNNKIFVTLGNFGIGYGTLNDDGSLADVGVLQLSTVAEIQETLFIDSFFKQIEILQFT